MGRDTPTSSAISVLDTPSAANSTIRARCAKPARIELDRVQDSNNSRSPDRRPSGCARTPHSRASHCQTTLDAPHSRHHSRSWHDHRTAAGDTVGTIFTSAVKDELISVNPALDVDRPKLDRDPVAPWGPDQVRMFLDRSAQHRIGPLFEVAILTGLRRGELCGLRWSDVD